MVLEAKRLSSSSLSLSKKSKLYSYSSSPLFNLSSLIIDSQRFIVSFSLLFTFTGLSCSISLTELLRCSSHFKPTFSYYFYVL